MDRRLRPRIIDTDWLVLTRLAEAIARVAGAVARPGMTAIDFGCGSRPYEAVFRGLGVDYKGADLGSGADYAIDGAGRMSAPSNAADLVVSFQVLEHVRDLETYFAECRRVMKADGRLILSTHGTWLYHPHPEDHRRWTREGLVAEVERNGFLVDECAPVVGPLAWTTIVRMTCFCVALRKAPVVGPLVAAAVALFMNVRAVVEEAVTPNWVTKDNACVYLILCRPAAAS